MFVSDMAVKKEIANRIALARGYKSRGFRDSIRINSRHDLIVNLKARNAIRIYDSKHNDAVSLLAVASFIGKVIVPLLLKAVASGIATGVAGAVATAVRPMVIKIVSKYRKLASSTASGDVTYSEIIISEIKDDLRKLLHALKREGSYLYEKLFPRFKKLETMT